MGLHADVGEGHFPSGCWMLSTVSQLMLHTIEQCSGQLWLQWVDRRPLLRFLARQMCWLTHTGNIWYLGSGYSHQLVEYPIFDLRVRLWVFRSLLDDGIYCHASKGCRTSRLDAVPIQSSPCHHYQRAVDAVSC